MLLLKKGTKGKEVKQLQSDLNMLGYKLKVDGIFGEATEKAVKSFQKKAKIAMDGIVGEETRKAIAKALLALKPKSKEKPKPKTKTPVVVLDVQHLGKKSKPNDLGAVCRGITEALYNLDIAHILRGELKDYEVIILVEDLKQRMDYSERHQCVEKIKPDLYIAMHLNAGGGSYSLFGYINDKSKRACEALAKAINTVYGNKRVVKVVKYTKGMRGYICISGVSCCPAILSEPLFVEETITRDRDKLVQAYKLAIQEVLAD